MKISSLLRCFAICSFIAILALPYVGTNVSATLKPGAPDCRENAWFCTEVYDSLGNLNTGYANYTGHDEPSLLFYSRTAGSGNSYSSLLMLPTDPPTLPNQGGTGGTFNFQLHPAFWFGMALCDTQSAPVPAGTGTGTCTPDSDTNIFDNVNPAAPDYMGKHPGTAYMEMQFYPPGWAPGIVFGSSCDPVKWCAALNIDSLSQNENTGASLNPTCANQILGGTEYINFAYMTKSGTPHGPPDPLNSVLSSTSLSPNPATDLFMNSGDVVSVNMHDTPSGFQVVINDLTTGQTGSMTASAANGFGQVQFDSAGKSCNVIPYDFHPMYASSGPHTRVVWAAHSYNVAFSDEIGHFEFCNRTDELFGVGVGGVTCPGRGVHDRDATFSGVDDDLFCWDSTFSLKVPVTGCVNSDSDFDGPEYQQTWPGTFTTFSQDKLVHSTPVVFTSPVFAAAGSGTLTNYDKVAFETDLPRIEFDTNPVCQRHVSNPTDSSPGAGCVDPPVGASFYPIYSTGVGTGKVLGNACVWQLGGANIPGTTNTFGGTSAAEYGGLLKLSYPTTGNTVTVRYNDFQNVLNSNPCPGSTQGS